MSLEDEIKRVSQKSCECVPCAHCDGTGIMGWSLFGGEIKRHRSDDLQEPVDCEECSFSGETCYRCQELEELYQEQERQQEERYA